MRSRRLPGLAVVTLDGGEQVGRVHRLVIDPKKKRVAALLVSSRGSLRKQLLPIDAVFALGSHAVTVQSREALGPLAGDERAALALKERIDLVGAPVITTRGELLGAVRDFEVTDRGEITALYVSGGLLRSLAGREIAVPGELLVALGRDAAVVDERAALLGEAEPERRPRSRHQAANARAGFRERLALFFAQERKDEAPQPGVPPSAGEAGPESGRGE